MGIMAEEKEKIVNIRKENIITSRGMKFMMITTLGPLIIGLVIRQVFGNSSVMQASIFVFIIGFCFFFFLTVTKKQLFGFSKTKYFKTTEINQDEFTKLKTERRK